MFLPHAMKSSDRIVFIHIPKTAGTSIRKYFVDLLGSEAVGWLGIHFSMPDLQLGVGFEKYKVIGGHFTRRGALHLPFEKVFVSTIREPVDRAVSYYNFIQNSAEHPLRTSLTGDFATDLLGIFGSEISQQQCHYLGWDPTAHSVRAAIADGRTGIATIDHVNEFLVHLTRLMGLEAVDIPFENIGQHTQIDITPSTLTMLKNILSEDMHLFRDLSLGHHST